MLTSEVSSLQGIRVEWWSYGPANTTGGLSADRCNEFFNRCIAPVQPLPANITASCSLAFTQSLIICLQQINIKLIKMFWTDDHHVLSTFTTICMKFVWTQLSPGSVWMTRSYVLMDNEWTTLNNITKLLGNSTFEKDRGWAVIDIFDICCHWTMDIRDGYVNIAHMVAEKHNTYPGLSWLQRNTSKKHQVMRFNGAKGLQDKCKPEHVMSKVLTVGIDLSWLSLFASLISSATLYKSVLPLSV